jgi:PadR family transcriptional regulator PadR
METFKKSYLPLLLLSLLEDGEMYGYRIAQAIKERTRGRYGTKEATLYPLLRELEKVEIIVGEWKTSPDGPPRKYFRLTPKGRKYLVKEREVFRDLAGAVLRPEGENG